MFEGCFHTDDDWPQTKGTRVSQVALDLFEAHKGKDCDCGKDGAVGFRIKEIPTQETTSEKALINRRVGCLLD